MPLYVIEREVGPGLTDEELAAAVKRSKKALKEMSKLKWIRSYVAAQKNLIYCVYESPDVESLYEHARKAQLPINEVSEVREITAATFK